MSVPANSTNGQGQPRQQYLTAEYKDGQLQIVEVTPYDRQRQPPESILPTMNCEEVESSAKYMQVLDGNKGLMQLDLLNLTIVRGPDGEQSYQLVANADAAGAGAAEDGTVACVLQSSGDESGEGPDGQQYVMVDTETGAGSLMLLQSSRQEDDAHEKDDSKKMPTPAEILEKAKALQKAKALMSMQPSTQNARKRKSDLPPAHEMLASPNFKLYLYSCKICNFKCNAIKDMSAHKASEHGGGNRSRGSSSYRGGAGNLQCARCPFRASSHSQLMKHVQDKHVKYTVDAVSLNTEEVDAADVLVCGACGFESSSKPLFRMHIEDEHGAKTC